MNPVDWGDWAIHYPYPGQEGFDGIHYGGIKGVKENAPDEIKKAFEDYKEALEQGIKA